MQPFDQALTTAEEIGVTVTGRKTGQPSARSVWFVLEGPTLYLLPVKGTDTEWFKNLRVHPTLTLTADSAPWTGRAQTITAPGEVHEVVEKFQKKYGAGEVAKYYSKLDVAVRVPLA
jgi:deazaflavin-dependent oxidoreductase (nitroreductase family)